MIEVIGDEEGSLICYSCDMLLVFFQESLANFFQAAQSLLAVRLAKHFQTYQFFLSFCWYMIWKIIIKKKTSGWLIRCADECSLRICLYIHFCLLSLMHWPAYWLTVWSPDFLTNWPVSSQIELTSWAMTTGWLKDGLIVCPTVSWTLHLASGHGYN